MSRSAPRPQTDAPAAPTPLPRQPASRTAAVARPRSAGGGSGENAPGAPAGKTSVAWPWALLALALLAAGAGAFWALSSGGRQGPSMGPPAPQLVRSAEVKAADSLEIRQTAFVRPLFEVDVAAEVGGRIARLGPDFRRGARVDKGAVLVQIDRETYAADLDQARAALEEARAALAEARIARNRAEALEGREFATEERLQNAILGEARAEAQLASARAGVTRARRALDDTTLEAPFDALVTGRTAAPGQYVQIGAALGSLVALEAAEAEMSLTPANLMLLGDLADAVGAKATLWATGPDPRPLGTGIVTDIDPKVEEQTRTTGLIVRIDGAFDARDPRPLRVDELVELALPARLPEGGVLALPPAALKDRTTVWRIVPEASAEREAGASPEGTALGTLEPAEVVVVQRTEATVHAVSDALAPGDRVMLSDIAAPFDGQTIRIVQETER